MPLAFLPGFFPWICVRMCTLAIFLNSLTDSFIIRKIHYRFTTLAGMGFQAFDTIFFITFYPCVYSWYCHIEYFCYF